MTLRNTFHVLPRLMTATTLGSLWFIGAAAVFSSGAGQFASATGAAFIGAVVPLWWGARSDNGAEKARQGTAILNTLRDEIWVLDATDLSILYLNEAASQRPNARVGNTLRDLLDPEDHVAFFEVLQAREMPEGALLRIKGATFEVALHRIREPNMPDRILLRIQDISERVTAERTKADFVSTVSHELRSPLTSIKGSMGLLLSNAAGELPTPARRMVEIAHRNAGRLVLILNDILDLEKIVHGGMDFELENVDLAALVDEAIASSSVYLQRFDLRMRVIGADRPLWVHTDANRILQVVTNLLTNAAKFSDTGGEITIKLEETAQGLRLSVRDEGIGIPQAEHYKIFQRFADMSNSDRAGKGGTGLGLSICKAIVDELGGAIDFQSAEGAGSTFYFTLPKQEIIDDALDDAIGVQKAG